jgi:hypothetical protein
MAPNLQNMGFAQNHHSTRGTRDKLMNASIPINSPLKISYRDLQFEQIPISMCSDRGTKYTRWVDTGMPKIDPEILDCVFFLYRTREDADKNEKSGGTGFFVGIPSEKFPEHHYAYAISNWHVVLEDGFPVIKVNTIDGKSHIIETEPSEWEFLPRRDDIAIYLCPGSVLDSDDKVILIPTILFATDEQILKREIGVGDDVFMIGRFIDYDGEVTNAPAVRFGNISIMPVHIKQRTGYMGKSYCLDLHSRSGFSGSPVFVYRTPGTNFAKKTIELSERFNYLLGIHWGQFPEQWEIVRADELPKSENHALITEGKYVKGLSGMTCVIPAQKILDILNLPSFRKQRMEGDIELTKRYLTEGFPAEAESAPTVPDTVIHPSNQENPQHKEDFNSLVSAAVKKKPQDD